MLETSHAMPQEVIMAKKTTLENTGTNTPKSGAHEENAKKAVGGKTPGASGRAGGESSAKPEAGAAAPATSADIGRDDPAIAD
jgi:hypothetical protein